ncbi:hypothetical protein F5Y10DRAFT_260343 [Nemania abortiva]|nr:hypothetical protein F5Y10DRAFT_260343 [Nemania abortiva]
MPKKWDDKSERDLLMAMRITESGYNAYSQDSWKKAAEVMRMMGYQDATWTGLSQRWSKVIQKNFQNDHPQALEVAAGTVAVAGPASAQATNSAPASGRRANRTTRPQKREREQEEQKEAEEGDDEVDTKTARAAKKQKKN